uniref:ATP synthase complex subunit 8 n=1 Tax=Teucriogethes sp. TaxID=3123426 RepID=A0AAN0N7Q5_9CUCU
MPQMMPLNWILLLAYFTLIFLMFNTLNYFSFLYKIKKSKTLMKKIKYNWKW